MHECVYIHDEIHMYIYTHTYVYIYIYIYIIYILSMLYSHYIFTQFECTVHMLCKIMYNICIYIIVVGIPWLMCIGMIEINMLHSYVYMY